MKKIYQFILLSILSLGLFISCPGVNDGPEKNPEDEPKKEEPENIDPLDFVDKDPGNVEKVLFTLELPEGTTSINIWRRHSNESEWYFNLSVTKDGVSNLPEKIELEDPYVNPGETYNYRVLLRTQNDNKFSVKHALNLWNGETRNFTPSTGYGEMYYKNGIPEYTYDEETTVLTLESPLDPVYPEYDAESEPEFEFLYYMGADGDSCGWRSIDYSFEKLQYNFFDLFMSTKGKRDVKGIGPGCVYYKDDMTIAYYGKLSCFSKGNISVQFRHYVLEIESNEYGLDILITKNEFDTLKGIDGAFYFYVYEDDKLLEPAYWMNSNAFDSGDFYKVEKYIYFPYTTCNL